MSLVDTYSRGWNDTDALGIPFLICSTYGNEWIPTYADETRMNVSDVNRGLYDFFYYITIPSTYVTEITTGKLRNALYQSKYIHRVKFPKTDIIFYVRKGLIYEVKKNGELKILLCSAYNKEEPDVFKLFIHPDVLGDTTYTRIKYYVLKYFVYEGTSRDNELVVTRKIKQKCFNPAKAIKIFGNVEEEDAFTDTIKRSIVNVRERVLPVIEPEVEEVEVEVIPESEVEEVPITQMQIEQALDELPVELPTAAEFNDAEEQVTELDWSIPGTNVHYFAGVDSVTINPASSTTIGEVEDLSGLMPNSDDIEDFWGLWLDSTNQIPTESTNDVDVDSGEVSPEQGTAYGYVDDEEMIFRQGPQRRRGGRDPSRSYITGGRIHGEY